jgi:hypothetical protein
VQIAGLGRFAAVGRPKVPQLKGIRAVHPPYRFMAIK